MYLHEEMGFCNTTHFKVKDLLYIKGVVLFLLFKKMILFFLCLPRAPCWFCLPMAVPLKLNQSILNPSSHYFSFYEGDVLHF